MADFIWNHIRLQNEALICMIFFFKDFFSGSLPNECRDLKKRGHAYSYITFGGVSSNTNYLILFDRIRTSAHSFESWTKTASNNHQQHAKRITLTSFKEKKTLTLFLFLDLEWSTVGISEFIYIGFSVPTIYRFSPNFIFIQPKNISF